MNSDDDDNEHQPETAHEANTRRAQARQAVAKARREGLTKARKVRRVATVAAHLRLAPRLQAVMAAGHTTLGAIAKELTRLGIRTSAYQRPGQRPGRPSVEQCRWTKTAVRRLQDRLAQLAVSHPRRYQKAVDPAAWRVWHDEQVAIRKRVRILLRNGGAVRLRRAA